VCTGISYSSDGKPVAPTGKLKMLAVSAPLTLEFDSYFIGRAGQKMVVPDPVLNDPNKVLLKSEITISNPVVMPDGSGLAWSTEGINLYGRIDNTAAGDELDMPSNPAYTLAFGDDNLTITKDLYDNAIFGPPPPETPPGSGAGGGY
jgi:hypothetical protein